MNKQISGCFLIVIGVLIYFMPVLLFSALGFDPLQEIWRIQMIPGVSTLLIFAGIPVLIGLIFFALGAEEHDKKAVRRNIERGVCAECGSSLSGYKVGCKRCTKVFCSDACSRRHYLNYHS